MATFADTIMTNLQLAGQRQYVSGMERATTSVVKLEKAQERIQKGARRIGGSLDSFGQSVTRWGARTAGAVGVVASAIAIMGLKFNSSMENAAVAYKGLLGSEDKATALLGKLSKLTTETPFRLDQVTLFGQQLLGAGIAGKDLVGTLQTVADATAGVGRPEALEAINRAIVQIAGSSQLYREDLNQLRDAGVPIYKLLQKRLHMTGKELDKALAKGTITNTVDEATSMNDVLGALKDQYKGMAKEQSKTFSGMRLSNLQDVGGQIAGKLTKPLFDVLEKKVFPTLLKFGDAASKVFDNTALTFDQKVQRIKALARQYLEPLGRDFKAWWDREDLGHKLDNFIDTASPIILKKIADLGTKAVGKFLSAWWESSAWTKIFVGLYMASKLGAFKILGGAAADYFVGAFAARLAAGGVLSGALAGAGAAIGTSLATFAAGAFTAKFLIDVIPPLKKFYESLGKGGSNEHLLENAFDWLKGKLPKGPSSIFPGHRAMGGSVAAGRPYIVGERRPELFIPQTNGRIEPNLASLRDNKGALADIPIRVESVVMLDGDVVARSVARNTAKRVARQGLTPTA